MRRTPRASALHSWQMPGASHWKGLARAGPWLTAAISAPCSPSSGGCVHASEPARVGKVGCTAHRPFYPIPLFRRHNRRPAFSRLGPQSRRRAGGAGRAVPLRGPVHAHPITHPVFAVLGGLGGCRVTRVGDPTAHPRYGFGHGRFGLDFAHTGILEDARVRSLRFACRPPSTLTPRTRCAA